MADVDEGQPEQYEEYEEYKEGEAEGQYEGEAPYEGQEGEYEGGEGGEDGQHEEQGEYEEGQYAEGEYAEGEYAEGEYAEGEYAEGEYAEGEYAEGEYAPEEAGYAEEPVVATQHRAAPAATTTITTTTTTRYAAQPRSTTVETPAYEYAEGGYPRIQRSEYVGAASPLIVNSSPRALAPNRPAVRFEAERIVAVAPPLPAGGPTRVQVCAHLVAPSREIQALHPEGWHRIRCLNHSRLKVFEFDRVFVHDPHAGPQDAYQTVGEGLVQDAMDGCDVVLLECGRRPRSFGADGFGELAHMLCSRLAEEARARMGADPSLTLQLWMSFLEVHNEEVHDLLEEKKPNQPSLTPLPVRGGRDRPVEIPNLSAHDVLAYESLDQLVMFGNGQRAWDVKGGEPLARSHAVLALRVLRRQELADGTLLDSMSTVHCVDLAGFQWQPRADPRWKREAKHINASLEVLCRTLQRYPHGYLPARDSKLTQLLSSSLGPNSRVALVAHVSPDAVDRQEALAALFFTESVKRGDLASQTVQRTVSAKAAEASTDLVDAVTGEQKKVHRKAEWSQYWSARHLPVAPVTPVQKEAFRRQQVISHRQRRLEEARAKAEAEQRSGRRGKQRPPWNAFFSLKSVALDRTAPLAPLVPSSQPAPPPAAPSPAEAAPPPGEPDILDGLQDDSKKAKTRPPWNHFFTKDTASLAISPLKPTPRAPAHATSA